MVNAKEITVGLLFFGTLIALGMLTVMLSDIKLFGKTYVYEIYFDDANELKLQDNVLIMGTRQGKVVDVQFFTDPIWSDVNHCDLWVKATIRMDIPLTLKKDYRITIRNSNLLGGKLMDIRLGRSRLPQDTDGVRLIGLAVRDPIEAISTFFERNKAYVRSILAHLDQTITDVSVWTEKISKGEGLVGRLIFSDSMAEDFENTVAGVDRLIADALRDDNVLDLLLRDPEVRTKLQKLASDLALISGNIAEGKGSLGKFINSPVVHDRVAAVAENVERITKRLDEGEGLVGKLLAPESEMIYRDLLQITGNIGDFVTEMVEGDGVVHALVYDGEIAGHLKLTFKRIDEITENIGAVVKNVREGKGPLGMLLYDEEVVDKLKSIVDHMLDGLEDAREASPVRSLGSFLFGAI